MLQKSSKLGIINMQNKNPNVDAECYIVIEGGRGMACLMIDTGVIVPEGDINIIKATCVTLLWITQVAFIMLTVNWHEIDINRTNNKCDIHSSISARISSIGRVFRSPLRSEEENGGPSASGGHLGWPHFRFPQMRSPKMATGSGRAAIFLLTPQWGSKNAPQVLDDVISGAAILDSRWRWWKWRLEDVETPVKTSYRRLPHPWVL